MGFSPGSPANRSVVPSPERAVVPRAERVDDGQNVGRRGTGRHQLRGGHTGLKRCREFGFHRAWQQRHAFQAPALGSAGALLKGVARAVTRSWIRREAASGASLAYRVHESSTVSRRSSTLALLRRAVGSNRLRPRLRLRCRRIAPAWQFIANRSFDVAGLLHRRASHHSVVMGFQTGKLCRVGRKRVANSPVQPKQVNVRD